MSKNELWNFLLNTISIKTFIIIVIIYFFIVWIAIIIWVIKDVNNRSDSILLQIFSILIVIIFGPLGIFIYLLIRPTRTFYEKYYEEVEGNIDFLTKSILEKLEKREIDEKSIIKKKKNINKIQKEKKKK